MTLELTSCETNGTFQPNRGGLHRLQMSFEQQLAGRYASLSAKLKEAADFVVSNPIDVATRSLRTISKDANLSPATFSRMSTAVGYDSYEDLREILRLQIEQHGNRFSQRIEVLQERHAEGDQVFLKQHVLDCGANLEKLAASTDQAMLDMCVDRLHTARRVLVLGALGSTGVAEYLTYMASFIADNWSMAGRMGASLASGLVGMSDRDVLIILTKPPFASNAIHAAREAHQAGAFVIVITDTHTCPALAHASAHFFTSTDSQHFFSSYAATLALCEIMIGMLAGRSGATARARIEKVETSNRRLSEVWDI